MKNNTQVSYQSDNPYFCAVVPTPNSNVVSVRVYEIGKIGKLLFKVGRMQKRFSEKNILQIEFKIANIVKL